VRLAVVDDTALLATDAFEAVLDDDNAMFGDDDIGLLVDRVATAAAAAPVDPLNPTILLLLPASTLTESSDVHIGGPAMMMMTI